MATGFKGSVREPVEVFFDLEATGLVMPEIIQFSAVGPASMGEFSKYVRPGKPIGKEASDLTGITWTGEMMYLNGVRVHTVSLKECLNAFLEYLGDSKVKLVAHNGHRFDGPLLLKSAAKSGLLDELQEHVVSFIDTLHIFRSFYPDLRGTRDRPYSQGALVERFLGQDSSGQHDAMDDARNLKRLMEYAKPPVTLKNRCTRSLLFILKSSR